MHSHPKLTAVTQWPTEIFLPPKQWGTGLFQKEGLGNLAQNCDSCLPKNSISHIKKYQRFC